jgi:hypothetical protein
MNRTEYIHKAEQLLQDTTSYKRLDNDPTKQLEKDINKTLRRLKFLGELSNAEYHKMRPIDSTTPWFYGLPKVHKEGNPLRPIVSLPGAPTYKLSKELRRRLIYLVNDSEYSIKSSDQFMEKIQNVRIEEDEIMVSFYVTALFTSVNPALAKQTIASLLMERRTANDARLSNASYMELLDLCLRTYFQFNGLVYEQTNGTPMGSPISGFVAEAVIQRLERIALPLIQPKL